MKNLGTACIVAFRQYIRAAEPAGAGTMVAEELGVTSRKLSQEGISYQKLLDEIRQKMAGDYLLLLFQAKSRTLCSNSLSFS